MCRVGVFAIFVAVAVLALPGCEGHQAKVDRAQKEYDRLAAQFQSDCSAEYYKVPPTLSSKCQSEKDQMDSAWKLLQTERAGK
jgi:type II secretory pathway pseudopilin PulG